MSIIGKGTLSLRKKDVTTQKSIGVGFTKVVFAHKASGGESSISLNSLVTPSELSSKGFVQPSPSILTGLNIYAYRRNLTLTSSLRGVLMDFLSYTVASNTLIKLQGFTLEPDEIITGVVDQAPRNNLSVVDGEAIAATGELAVSATDFAVGTPFETNKYPTQQIGAVKVYRNGLLQARCEGNSLANDGNYIEVPVSGGLGSLIRFKTAPAVTPDNIIVTSNGAYFERPNASMMANIEALGGQLDKVVEVLSVVSGQPEIYFQSNPNQVDLRQFGDIMLRILDMEVANSAEPTNWTPTFTNFSATVNYATYTRIGKYALVEARVVLTSAVTGNLIVGGLPFSLDAGLLGSTNRIKNTAIAEDNGTGFHMGGVEITGSSTLQFVSVSGGTRWANTAPFIWTSNDILQFQVWLPVDGWTATQTVKQKLGL